MPGVSGIRRVQACVGKLDGAAQPGSLRTAKTVHTDQGCGPHCIDHGRRQLPQGQPGVPGHAGGQCRHRPDAPHRQGMLRPHGDQDLLGCAGAKSIRRHPPVADAQHQHRAFRRQQGPQLGCPGLDHIRVPLVQDADAGHLQRDVPPPGPCQPLPRDLHPGDRDPAALRCGQPHPGGQLCLRAAEQLVGHICRAHFPTLPSVRGLQTPVFRAKYGKIETFPNKNQKNACVGTANMVS